jgi:ATP-dependent Clp protease adapter protein ClpS
MTAVAKIVSELFMLVLSVIAAPSDLKEFQVDLIQHSGRVETMIVRRTDVGFSLLEQQGDRLIEKGSIRPVAGKPSAFTLTLGDVPEQTYDFAAGIQGFTVEGLQKAQTLDLKAGDGVVIHVHRSGTAVYLTPERGRMTYACH